MSWTQTTAFTNVNISALVGSIDGSSRLINAYLTSAVGPAAGAPLSTASLTVPSFASEGAITPTTLFSGLALGPGSYYLTLFSPDTTGNVNLRWARGTNVTLGGGVTANGELFSNTTNGIPDTANPWKSTFVTSSLYDNAFTVTGDAVIPEPGTIVAGLCVVAVAAFSGCKRRRTA